MAQYDVNIASRIKEKILQIDPDAKVILYGSRAKGNANKDSDWDILVLIDKPLKSRADDRSYRHQVFDLELEIGQPISVFVLSEEDWSRNYLYSPLFQIVNLEGVVL